MKNRLPVVGKDGVQHFDRGAVVADDGTTIARLPPTLRIEDRAVELDAKFVCCDHACLRLAEIGVGSEEKFGAHRAVLLLATH